MIKYRISFCVKSCRSLTTSDNRRPLGRKICKKLGQWDSTLNPVFSITSLSQTVPSWDSLGQKSARVAPLGPEKDLGLLGLGTLRGYSKQTSGTFSMVLTIRRSTTALKSPLVSSKTWSCSSAEVPRSRIV